MCCFSKIENSAKSLHPKLYSTVYVCCTVPHPQIQKQQLLLTTICLPAVEYS